MAAPLEKLDAPLFTEAGESLRQFFYDGILPRAQLGDVDLGPAENNSPPVGRFHLANQLGRVKQRLGRDAAAIQTNSAEALFPLDQNNFFPLVRGVERRRVTAGAAADNDNLRLKRFHLCAKILMQNNHLSLADREQAANPWTSLHVKLTARPLRGTKHGAVVR